ncbi:MAG: PTS mannose/fructose/sorbose/N-acetylgalactosamine transporter subunit IIC [Erysipelotrichaceae bacterium]
MDITILQAVLIGLWTAFCFSGMLLGIYTNRCIILSFGVGVILGDIPTALSMGAISELAYMGFGVGAGGTVPPNPIGPGIFGTLMAITSKGAITPAAALALSTPIAVAIQFVQTFAYTIRAGAPEGAAKALASHNMNRFKFESNATIWIFAIIGFSLGCAGALSMESVLHLIDYIPPVLLNGLSVAGKMLPAIGFAMILSVMAKKELIPFILLGYVCAAYLGLPVIGIAIVGTIFALIEFFRTPATAVAGVNSKGDEKDDWI